MHQDEEKEARARQAIKNINRTVMEWDSLVIASDYCFSCLEKKNDKSLAMIALDIDNPNNPQETYSNVAVPICKDCSAVDPVDINKLGNGTIKALDLGLPMYIFKKEYHD